MDITTQNFHPQKLAKQYRQLADWIENTEVVPWHISIDWNSSSLLIHLYEEEFFHFFKDRNKLQLQDRQGTTWRLQDKDLVFTCFVPHLIQKESA